MCPDIEFIHNLSHCICKMAQFGYSEMCICKILLHCNVMSHMSYLHHYGRQYIVMVSIVAISDISCYCHIL